MKKIEPTLSEIFEIVNFIKDNGATKDQIVEINARIDKIDGRIDKMDGRIDKIDGRIDKMDGRLTRVESQMVTKEYLDDKLADLKGDLTVVMRKEDTKLKALVEILAEKKVITPADKQRVLSMQPFPTH